MRDELDSRLKDLYASIPKEEPSEGVDAAILKAAGQPVSAPRKQDWLLSFGAVASVVMVSTLVVYLQTRAPDELQKAVRVSQAPVVPLPVAESAAPVPAEAEPLVAAGAMQDSAAPINEQPVSEQEMAERRSAELSRLRAEFAARKSMERKNEVIPPAPVNLPTLKLRPATETPAKQELAAGDAETGRADDLRGRDVMEQRGVMASAPTPAASAASAAAKPDMALAKRKAASEADTGPVAIASVLMEGVSLGMHRDALAAMGWICAQAVCSRPIADARQPAYWGMTTSGSTQRVMLVHDTVTAMTLSQVNVPVNNVKLALEKIGKPIDAACPLTTGDRLAGRQVGGMVLGLWQDGELTVLGVCQVK